MFVSNRIYFCDELRGFASFIVMIAHLTIGFNGLKGFLYNPQNSEIYPEWFINLFPFDGAFGVAIFFLISGFVIPFSLSDRKPFEFLLSRIIRIYPVFIVSSIFTLLFLIYFGLYKNNLISNLSYLSCLTLFRDWIGGIPIDGVIWTLEIEVKFYLYIAFFLFLLKKYPSLFILMPAFIIFIVVVIFDNNINYPSGLSLNSIYYNLGYINYMNIGVVLYLRHKNIINIKKTFVMISILILVTILFLDKRYNDNLIVIELYISAFFLFIFAYIFLFNFKGVFYGFWANISYPLYLVHSTIGYILLSVFTYKFDINIFISLLIVILIVVYISFLLHKYIERPTLKKSKEIKNREV